VLLCAADQLKNMQVSIDQMKQISDKAKSTWDKFRKERDFHKMHHKRVVQVPTLCSHCLLPPSAERPLAHSHRQEKNKLVVDLKRLKNHYANYEPMLKMMRGKYETAMKASPSQRRLHSTHPSASPLRARSSSARRHVSPFHAFRRRCSSSWSATV
jgi:hypothetical protein